MKVYLVCRYFKEDEPELSQTVEKLYEIVAVTTDYWLAKELAKAASCGLDKRSWVVRVKEFDVYGKV